MYVDADSDLWADPMTIRLSARAGVDPLTAGAIILRLRQWGAATDQQNITGILPLELATTLGYHGDADKLWEGLHAAGFLVSEGGETLLGEYHSHILPVVKRAKNQAEYQRNYRERKAASVSASVSANAGVNTGANESPGKSNAEHVFIPSSLHPPMHVSHVSPIPAKPDYTPDFEAFWSAYPKKLEKLGAFKCWNTRLKEKHTAKDMIAAAQNYAKAMAGKEFVKHPTTFLGPSKPFLDYVNGVPAGAQPEQPWSEYIKGKVQEAELQEATRE